MFRSFMIKLLVLTLALGFPPISLAATILVFGDSISAGYGLPQSAGWVSLLSRRVAEVAPGHKVINASISGETAAGGRLRIIGALAQHKPSIVVLELGGNDGLRGARVEAIQADLDAMVTAIKRHPAKVVLVGMRLPPNYGAAYIRQFQEIYGTVARKHAVAFAPFLFEGFGDRQEFFQSDGIHPTREAQALMLETVWKALGPLLSARVLSPPPPQK